MAYQHFYSRVPARLSIFNRTDGFDTFAYSDGLEREFIEKELSAIYDNKPSKTDGARIRNGELPPLYCQYFTKSGVLAQGCIGFLAKDYTGERSAYVSHILIPDGKEEKEILDNPENAPLNPAVFQSDLTNFPLTSPELKPNNEYPTVPYKTIKAEPTESLTQYDSAMMKRLIFSMLNIACGKGKNVFISLPYPISEFSAKSLDFINTLLQIFPYHLRRAFSFVTYTDDATRFTSFNLRFIPESAPEIPAAKGITLHFGSKIAVGLSDELVASNSSLVEFFYGLLKFDETRREFLYFMQLAVQNVPELKKMNMKTLNELVFLFQQCSGLFQEKTILPDNSRMFDFVCAYEKHRKALSNEHRTVALKCLKRYPENHEAIPKDVFSRLSKIYATEPTPSKRNIMNVVLELIHTDVMRDKLFNFIKNNYANEDPEIRAAICNDLCRVYYGGFLQPQILNFFEQNFSEESAETKNAILDKLLLTIRTESVRKRILAFFDQNFDVLTEEQRTKFLDTCYEMLPEGDALAEDLVQLLNVHFENAPKEEQKKTAEKLYQITENNQKRKQPKLLPLLLNHSGFCANAVTKIILTEHSNQKIFESFTAAYVALPQEQKVSFTKELLENNPDLNEETAQKFADTVCAIQREQTDAERIDLYTLIECDQIYSEYLNGTAAQKLFIQKILDEIIHPAIAHALPEAFSVKRRRDGLPFVLEYAQDKTYLTESNAYHYLAAYQKMVTAIESQNHAEMIASCEEMPEKVIRTGAADHLKIKFYPNEEWSTNLSQETCMLLHLLLGYMKTHEFDFVSAQNDFNNLFSAKVRSENPKLNPEAVSQSAAQKTMELLLKTANELYGSAIPENLRMGLTETGSTLTKSITSFLSSQKKGVKWIKEQLNTNSFHPDFAAKIESFITTVPTASGGLFKRLFGK